MSDEASTRWEDTRKAWEEVVQRFTEVGRRVGRRYSAMGPEKAQGAKEDGEIGDAIDQVVRQLDQAFTSVGDTLRDPEAKETLQRAVRSFGDALATTFSEVGEQVRRKIGSSSTGEAERATGSDRPH